MSEFFTDPEEPLDQEEASNSPDDEITLAARQLQGINPFCHFSLEDLLPLAHQLEVHHFNTGEIILNQYDALKSIVIVTDEVIVSEMNRYVEDQTKSGLFGVKEILAGDETSPWTLTALSDSDIWLIPRDDFLNVIRNIPGLTERLLTDIVKDLSLDLLERKKEKTNIQEQRRLTREILEHMGVGTLTINQSGEIGQHYNNLAETYLEKTRLAGVPFADIIMGNDREALRKYYQALQLLFSGNRIDPEMIISLLPKNVEINQRLLQLDYSFVQDTDGNVSYVFVRMADHTLERRLEEKEIAEKKIMNIMQTNIGSYMAMLEDVSATLKKTVSLFKLQGGDNFPPDEETLADVMRSLHSSKGVCGQHELSSLKQVIHNLEDEMQHLGKREPGYDPEKLKSLVDGFKKEVAYAVSLKNSLGPDIIKLLQGVTFSKDEFNTLLDAVNRKDIADTGRLILDKTLAPAENIFDNWEKDIRRISEKSGKEVIFSAEVEKDLKLQPALIQKLNVELGHIYRNCVDHGLEPPGDREKRGKNRSGHIDASVQSVNNTLLLKISDDGIGLDRDKIVQAARNNTNLSQQKVEAHIDSGEIWKILFIPGFSSSKTVTSTSGRGIGLDAVLDSTINMGGFIRVESEANKGTAFIIEIPLRPDLEP